ncbi:hypothetical protein HanIR_Chr04g0175541 [Helianthus annuus]|nr:hypothetical protein HanIR_Chr04g0175541 [Helianthus annuus]
MGGSPYWLRRSAGHLKGRSPFILMGWNVNMGRTPFITWILFDNRQEFWETHVQETSKRIRKRRSDERR